MRPRKSERKWWVCKPASSLYRSWSLALQGLPTSSDTHTTSYKSVPLATPLTFGLWEKLFPSGSFTFVSAGSSFLVLKPTSTHAHSFPICVQLGSFSLFLLLFWISLSCWPDLLNQVEQYLRSLHLPNLRSHCFGPSSDTSCYTLLLEQISTAAARERGGCYYRYCYLLKHPLPQTFTSIYILPA